MGVSEYGGVSILWINGVKCFFLKPQGVWVYFTLLIINSVEFSFSFYY